MELYPWKQFWELRTTEDKWQPLSVIERQRRLLEKLDMDRLSNWTPHNAAAAQELVLSFHNIFTLNGHELCCTSAVDHEIQIKDSELFKE